MLNHDPLTIPTIAESNANVGILARLNENPQHLIGNRGIPEPIPLPDFSGIEEKHQAKEVRIDMGGIVMNGVNDPKEFTSNLISAINTSPAVKKVMQNHTIGTLASEYNSLSGRQFAP